MEALGKNSVRELEPIMSYSTLFGGWSPMLLLAVLVMHTPGFLEYIPILKLFKEGAFLLSSDK